jgi:hypothetical protein
MKALVLPSLVSTLFFGVGCAPVEPLRETPQDRNLAAGKVVFVDDGSCPSGEIKRVTGGNQNKGIPRESVCVQRPK